MGAKEEMQARYAEARARLGRAPAPVKKVIVKPAYEDVEAEIDKRRRLLEGCALSARLKMLIIDILVEGDTPWLQAMQNFAGSGSRLRPERAKAKATRDKIFQTLLDDGMSLSEVGRACGYDHTTIYYAIRKRPRTRPKP